MQKLNHPNIIKPIEMFYIESKETYIIIQEFFEG